jgi:hypothetical protein
MKVMKKNNKKNAGLFLKELLEEPPFAEELNICQL